MSDEKSKEKRGEKSSHADKTLVAKLLVAKLPLDKDTLHKSFHSLALTD